MHPSLLLLLFADLGFSSGLRPLDVGVAAREVSAARCAECHEEQVEEWAGSRHRISVTNAIFSAGFAAEPEARCIRCHGPLPEQLAEVAAARRSQAPLPVEGLVAEGVTCAVCHVRDGEAHGNDALRSDDLCGGCHQFPFHEKKAGRLVLKELLIQSTYDEWKRYAASGGKETCISCHMPKGTHAIRGAHDPELLRAALLVRVEEGALVLESRGVGHDLPTGDVFRHVDVEVEGAGAWKPIARIGRRYEAQTNEDGSHSMTLVEHTSLAPGETRILTIPEGARRWRVRYCYDRACSAFLDVAAGEGSTFAVAPPPR